MLMPQMLQMPEMLEISAKIGDDPNGVAYSRLPAGTLASIQQSMTSWRSLFTSGCRNC